MLKVCLSVAKVRTYGPMKLFDITNYVAEAVKSCGVCTGIVRVDVKGATPALVALSPEDCEDFVEALTKLVPFSKWRHGNAYAHLSSTALSTSLTLAVENGELVLPKGARVYLLETRSVYNHLRNVIIELIGK